MTNDEILAATDVQPLRTDVPIPTCEHRVSIEVQCAACDEIDLLAEGLK